MHKLTVIKIFLFILLGSLISEYLSTSVTAQVIRHDFKKRPKIGLVLSGGGAKGIAHVGVLKIIEKSGMKIDYITGTSMGSIIGGLYASGYTADMLEKLVLSLEWDEILGDNVSRRNVSIDEKGDNDKYIGSLPLRKWGIDLPKGYKRGQKLTSMLSRWTLHVQHIKNFDKLPIPFRCIGTNIVTGEAVVLKEGYLPDAMRASMAIPSIFTPVEIGDHLLVDGGVIRNLPVSDIREMGADIIIAVDVGAPLYKKDELKSITEIMDQSVSLLGARSTQEQRLLTDILLVPDIKGFTGSDFKRGKELIAVGEEAGRVMLPELIALRELQNSFPEKKEDLPPMRMMKALRITKINIHGLKHVSQNLVLGKLQISAPAKLTPEQLSTAVDRVYASGFFDRVTYQVEPVDDKNNVALNIRVTETSGVFLKVGFNFDSDMNAAILANVTFRNMAGLGSKISIDARLSEFPGFAGSYFIHTPLQTPGVGFGVNLHYDKYNFYTYSNGDIKASYDYQNVGGNVLFQTIILNYVALGIAAEKDLTFIKTQITPDNPGKNNIEGLNYYAYVLFDNLDRTFYPRSGFQLYAEAKFLTDDLKMIKKTDRYDNFYKYTAKMKGYIPFHKRVSMYLGISGGFILAHEPYKLNYEVVNGWTPQGLSQNGWTIYRKKIPFIYENYMGGLNTYNKAYLPFSGLNFMQISGKNMLVLDAGIQIEPVTDFYIILRGNVGRVKSKAQQLFQEKNLVIDKYYNVYYPKYQHLKNDLIYGYGLTLGYNSIIGPIEATLMRGSESNKFLFHVNIGYRM